MIRLKGKTLFNPENKTRKHGDQASWKKMAMAMAMDIAMLDGDICEYYSRFILKRYRKVYKRNFRKKKNGTERSETDSRES